MEDLVRGIYVILNTMILDQEIIELSESVWIDPDTSMVMMTIDRITVTIDLDDFIYCYLVTSLHSTNLF